MEEAGSRGKDAQRSGGEALQRLHALCCGIFPNAWPIPHPAGQLPGFSEPIQQVCPPHATFPPPECFLKRDFALVTAAKSLVELDPGFSPARSSLELLFWGLFSI